MDSCHRKIISQYTHTSQATPAELGAHIPSKSLHIRSLCNGLSHIKLDLRYVIHALRAFDDVDFIEQIDTTAHKLTSATIFLAGFLDGLVMLDNEEPSRSMDFQKTPFQTIELRELQEGIKSLKSFKIGGQETYADFWTIANYWKHYYPFHPPRSHFDRYGINDFAINFGNNSESGPLMRDLIVPTFNAACKIAKTLAKHMECDEIFYERLSDLDF